MFPSLHLIQYSQSWPLIPEMPQARKPENKSIQKRSPPKAQDQVYCQ